MSRPRKASAHLARRAGITEQPAGSNTDRRKDGIRAMQIRVAGGGTWLVGLAWCGTACADAVRASGVKIPKLWRWASVANIEDDARAHTNGFLGWTTDAKRGARRGNLAVLFGRGVHVGTVRWRVGNYVWLWEGNTSSDDRGSQNNGGGLFPKRRHLSQIHGFAVVAYPGRKL